jgi:hypothetical protein
MHEHICNDLEGLKFFGWQVMQTQFIDKIEVKCSFKNNGGKKENAIYNEQIFDDHRQKGESSGLKLLHAGIN